MKVLISAASLDLSGGGPSENIPKLADALERLGVDVGVLCGRYGSFHSTLREGDSDLFYPPEGKGRLAKYPRFVSQVVRRFGPDIIHDNGIWLPENHIVGSVAAKADRKLVVSIRGMLDSWPLQFKATKKKIAWLLYQRRDLRRAHGIVATSEKERGNILKKLPGSTVAVVPNGWDPLGSEAFERRVQSSTRARTALFFSRVHTVKGIEVLIEAWSRLRPDNWELKIVGPGEKTYLDKLRSLAVQMQIDDSVHFSLLFTAIEKNIKLLEQQTY